MKLTRLRLNRLPGLAHAVEITNLIEGMNFVFGPNGSGKSSLIRGLRWVLEPDDRDPLDLHIEADFIHQGQGLRAVRQGRAVQWQTLNAQGVARDCAPPTLPAQGVGASVITIDDLLGMERGGERELADVLLREINQGFDLRPLRDEQFKPIRLHAARRNALHEARDALNQCLSTRRSLAEQRQTLATLNDQIETAKDAERQRHSLTTALALLAAERQRRQLEQQLASLPASMAQLSGREADEHDALMQQRAAQQQKAEQAARAQAAAKAALAATGLAKARPDDVDVQARRTDLTALSMRRQDLDELMQERAAAEADWQLQRRALSGTMATDAPRPDLSPTDIDDIERLANAFEAVQRQGHSPFPDVRTWPSWSWALGGAGVAVALAGAASAQWWLNGLGVGLIVLAWGLPLWRRQSGPTAATSTPPSAPHQALLAERAALGERLQLDLSDLGTSGWALRTLLQRLQAASAAEAHWQKLAARCAELQQQIDAGVQSLSAWLAQWDEAADGLADLTPALDRLAARVSAADRHQREIEQQAQIQQGLAAESTRLQQAHQTLMQRLALSEDDIGLLPQRMQQHQAWQRLQHELEQQRRSAASHHAELENHAALLALVEADDEDSLNAQRTQAEDQAQALNDLLEQRAELKQQLALAERSDELQRATEAYHQQVDQVRSLRDQAVLHAAGRWWVDEIDQAYRNDRPLPLLAEAQRVLGRFTDNQWTLSFDEGQGMFTARDQLQQADRRLSELSTATRMQLLMALRLARLHTAEAGAVSLPIWVDEALATSDVVRMQAVLKALADEIEAEARQVIVLSATDHELQLWQHCIDGQPAHHQWLPHPAQGSVARSGPALRLTLPAAAPAPAEFDDNPSAYAKALAVPAIDLDQSFSALPLFYLLMDDLAQLHGLLNDWRLSALGPLKAWLVSPAAASHADQAQALRLRVQVAELWWAAIQQGRPRPVTQTMLVDSGVVSETMLAPVWALAQSVQCDGRALIAGLRDRQVARFQESRIDLLEAHLVEASALLDSAPLDAEQRLQQVLMHCSDAARPLAQVVVSSLEQGVEQGVGHGPD